MRFLFFICSLLFFIPQSAFADIRLAILEFRGVATSTSLLELLTDEARTGVVHISQGRKINGQKIIIMTRENIRQILKDQGKDISCVDGEMCEVEVAKELGADFVISGSLTKIETLYALVVKLHSTEDSNLLTSEILKTESQKELLTKTADIAQKVFAKGLNLRPTRRPAQSSGFSGQGSDETWEAESTEKPVIVRFDSTPSGAGTIVMVDGRVVCSTTPCSKSLSSGLHEVNIQRERYQPWQEEQSFKKGSRIFAKLSPDFGVVTVTSDIPDITFSLNNETIVTPAKDIELDKGQHTLTLTDKCYRGKKGEKYTFSLSPGERKDVSFPVRIRPAGLKVSVQDKHGNDLAAKAYVDGKYLGETPDVFTISVCSKELSIDANGQSASQKLNLEERKTREITLQVRGTNNENSHASVQTQGWGLEIEQQFVTHCNAARPDTISVGEMNRICVCAVNRLQQLFTYDELGTPAASKMAEEIGVSCAQNPTTSWGNSSWLSTERQQFIQECVSVRPDGISISSMNELCTCALKKIENRYSIAELSSQEAISFSEQAGETCAHEILGR